MAIKFLYLDDEPDKADGIVKPLVEARTLEFTIERPQTWNEQRKVLIDQKGLDNYDGLLLDLKLEFSDGNSNDIKFNGADLAQSIRTDAKSNLIKDLPIFLCSTNDNFMAFFDRTSVDLFDKKYKKESDFEKDETKIEFFAFANAYKTIHENRDIANLLKKSAEENTDLVVLNSELEKCGTPHEIVYLINRYMIQCNGLLIDEALLAIRLGVDIEHSGDWEALKEGILLDFKYRGILSDCYDRWWQNELLNWWRRNFEKSLIVLSAEERVGVLKEKFNLQNINPLLLPPNHRFDTFWYQCRLSNYPLDPTDAFRTTEMPRYAWQEPSYISMAYITSDERNRQSIVSLLGANERAIFEDL